MPKKQARKKATRGTSTRRSTANKVTVGTAIDEPSCNACGVYTAEGGETLAALAVQFSVDEKLLATINPFIDANAALAPFEQINIPAADFDLRVLEPPIMRSRSRGRTSQASEDPAFSKPIKAGPGWYEVALGEMTDVCEQDPAPLQDLRYLRYLMTTDMESTNDESASGSAFVHWCLIRAGLLGTASTKSLSWLDWNGGRILRGKPKLGAIVVFKSGKDDLRQGPHVALYAGPDDDAVDTILALGCHLNNRPSILPYPKDRIIAYCWPST